MREESWPTSSQRGIGLRLVHPSGARRSSGSSPGWRPDGQARRPVLLPAGGHYLLGFAEHGFSLGEVLYGLLHFRIVHELRAVGGLLIESPQVELVADLLRHPLFVAVPLRVGEGDGDGARLQEVLEARRSEER